MEKNNSVRNKDTKTNYTFLKYLMPLYSTSIKFIAPCISKFEILSKSFQIFRILKNFWMEKFWHIFKRLHAKFHEIILKNVGVMAKKPGFLI